jgi:HlyD family secretion protein
LSRTEIRSPIDGIVIQADVKVGEAVIAATTNIPGSTLVVVADPSEMLTEVQVDEADIALVRLGQSADVYAAAHPDTPLSGKVESIAAIARRPQGQQSLSFLVKILLDPSDILEMRPGMSARADIYTETAEDALIIPVQAVMYDEGDDDRAPNEEDAMAEEQPYVMLMAAGKAVRRDVKLGISSDSDQEILEGLSAGETVVSGPYRVLRHLKDGEAIEVKEAADDDREDGEDDQ